MAHAQRGGFCPFHAWRYVALASPQGIAKTYPPLLMHVAAALRRQCSDADRRTSNSTPLKCPSCAVAVRAEREAIVERVQRLRERPEAAAGDSTFCVPHLRELVASLGTAEAVTLLLRHEAALLERLAEDMQRYALKHDALRRALTSDEERCSADNAVLLLSGKRNLSGPAGRTDYL